MKILVVEDSQPKAELLRGLMERQGFQVVIAIDGQEGLQLAKTGGFDLIVSDLNLPLLDGYALIRAIRLDKGIATTPFLLYSSSDTTDEAIALASFAGATDYVRKEGVDGIMDSVIEQIKKAIK